MSFARTVGVYLPGDLNNDEIDTVMGGNLICLVGDGHRIANPVICDDQDQDHRGNGVTMLRTQRVDGADASDHLPSVAEFEVDEGLTQ